MEHEKRELIQIITLAEVCRELGPSLIFQGGTAIRIFLGGTRRSEDLDFYIDSLDSSRLEKAAEKIFSNLTQVLDYVDGVGLESYRLQHQDRLHTIWFTFVQGKTKQRARLKAEFYQGGPNFGKIKSNANLLATAPLVKREISSLSIFLDRLNLVVQVETPQSVLADKMVALLARPHVKGRDLWDIWFLRAVLEIPLSREEIELRKRIYGISAWKRYPLMGGMGWPPQKELMEILDRDLKRFLDQEELRYLRAEGYKRILNYVEGALAELAQEGEG